MKDEGKERELSIKELKQAEELLRASRDTLENIIESSLDSIVVVDLGGYLTRANNAFSQLTGFSKREVIGKHMSEFAPLNEGTYESTTGELIQIDKEFYNHINSNMLQFHKKGAIQNVLSYLLRKDNKIVPVEDSMVYLFDKDGIKNGALAITRDITGRKKAEQKILDYQDRLKSLASQITLIEERERRYFAEYLHDEIGQHLFASQMHLKLLKNVLIPAEHVKTIDKVLHNIEQMIHKSRLLTYELSSPILYELGLEKALEWLAEHIHEQYNMMVTIEDDNQEKPLDDDMKIFLYRAVRELLTNVMKYAQTEKAMVSIQKDNSTIRICVEDHGIGFNFQQHLSSKDTATKGFGLFRIIERLDQLGGHLEIKSQPNRGARITLVAPLDRT